MNWRIGMLNGFWACCWVLLTGCTAESLGDKPIVEEPQLNGGCDEICVEQNALNLQFPNDGPGVATLVVLHKAGVLSSENNWVDIESLSPTASKLIYDRGLEKERLGVFQDVIDISLQVADSDIIASLGIPVTYEWFRAFQVLGGYGKVAYELPAKASVGEAIERGVFKERDSVNIRVLGAYADWHITDISEGLELSTLKGLGDTELELSFARDVSGEVGHKVFGFTVHDTHSERSRKVEVVLDFHERSLDISSRYTESRVVAETSLEDLAWPLTLSDATGGLAPERQVTWEFITVPKGFEVTPSVGHSGTTTDVIIKPVERIRYPDSGYYQFELQQRDAQGSPVGDLQVFTMRLEHNLPLLKALTPSQINTGAVSQVLFDLSHATSEIGVYVGAEEVELKAAPRYFRDAPVLPVGELTLSRINQHSKVFDDRQAITVVDDRIYPQAPINLGWEPQAVRYQMSSQALLLLNSSGGLFSLQTSEGQWRKSACSAGDELVGFEMAFDDVIAVSRTETFQLITEPESCSLVSIQLSDDTNKMIEEGVEFEGVGLLPTIESSYGVGGYLSLNMQSDSAIFTDAWPLYFGDSLSFEKSLFYYKHGFGGVDELSDPGKLKVSGDRFSFIHESALPKEREVLESASLSYRGDHIILQSGNIFREDEGNLALVGQITQNTGDSGLANVMSFDGQKAWRLYRDDERIWLKEFALEGASLVVPIVSASTIELPVPEDFSWHDGSPVNLLALPDGNTLLVALGQWLWAVEL